MWYLPWHARVSTEMHPDEWLLIELPDVDDELAKYFLCAAPPKATQEQMMFVTHAEIK